MIMIAAGDQAISALLDTNDVNAFQSVFHTQAVVTSLTASMIFLPASQSFLPVHLSPSLSSIVN